MNEIVMKMTWLSLVHHPEGMKSLSPATVLRGTSYPGTAMDCGGNPERVAAWIPVAAVNPAWWQREGVGRGGDATLTGLTVPSMLEPRVARASQPWAKGYNPFGIAWEVRSAMRNSAVPAVPASTSGRPMLCATRPVLTAWLLATALCLLAPSARAATNDLTSAIQRGLFEEEANQNLGAAIQAYQAVANQLKKGNS